MDKDGDEGWGVEKGEEEFPAVGEINKKTELNFSIPLPYHRMMQ